MKKSNNFDWIFTYCYITFLFVVGIIALNKLSLHHSLFRYISYLSYGIFTIFGAVYSIVIVSRDKKPITKL